MKTTSGRPDQDILSATEPWLYSLDDTNDKAAAIRLLHDYDILEFAEIEIKL